MVQNDFDQQPSQTAAKAIAVLEAFDADHPERGIRELGRELGINAATVHRLVTTLANAGYLEQNPETQRYALGPKVMKLANLYIRQNPVSAVARKVFESFADRFEYNFYLGKFDKYEVVYQAVLDGRGPMRIVVETGGTAALHATAAGKLLLALQSDDVISRFLDSDELVPFTPRTVTDPDQLWEQIEQIRERKFAVNDGELYDEIGAIAVPVYGERGSLNTCVSLAYPRHLVNENRIQIEKLIPLAREIAEVISTHTANAATARAVSGKPEPLSSLLA